MQTFLPYSDFRKSASVLDTKRLGKQRVECMQILNAMEFGGGWANHPATRMWRGHEDALKAYMAACIDEWLFRGYKNTMRVPRFNPNYKKPRWLGNREFHLSHKSNLLRKQPVHYGMYFRNVPDNLPYTWPEP